MKGDAKRGTWRMVHAERAALVADLARFDLDPQNARGAGPRRRPRAVKPEHRARTRSLMYPHG